MVEQSEKHPDIRTAEALESIAESFIRFLDSIAPVIHAKIEAPQE